MISILEKYAWHHTQHMDLDLWNLNVFYGHGTHQYIGAQKSWWSTRSGRNETPQEKHVLISQAWHFLARGWLAPLELDFFLLDLGHLTPKSVSFLHQMVSLNLNVLMGFNTLEHNLVWFNIFHKHYLKTSPHPNLGPIVCLVLEIECLLYTHARTTEMEKLWYCYLPTCMAFPYTHIQ